MSHQNVSLFELAFESSPTGKVVTDRAGTILIVNQETDRMFGYDRGELVGQSVDVLVPLRYRGHHPANREAFHRAPGARPMGAGRDLYGLRKDGVEIPIEIGLNPVVTAEGTLILAAIVDISQRRALEQRLRQAQKLEAIGTLTGGIAHDFNNLLRAIVGYTELVTAATSDPKALADLEQVRRAAARGQDLVLRMLAFSRPSEPVQTAASLDAPVRETIDLLHASIPSLVEIHTHLDTDTPPVRIDATQVQQVLLNLVTNAAQALQDASGTIEVSLSTVRLDPAFVQQHQHSKPGLYVRLTVADTGPGMDDEVLQHVFEPFFTTKPVGKGSGLGLAMVHGIVHGAGGFVDVQSRTGSGTTVHVYLPAAPAEVPDSPATAADPDAPHVLFVDDEEVIAELSRRQLTAAGFRVTAYSSSLKALEDFRTRPDAFALVVTDNTMPRMSGLQLSQEILRLRPTMPILLVSGLVDTLAPEVIYQRGIAGLLRKPHTGPQLVSAARALTDKSTRPA